MRRGFLPVAERVPGRPRCSRFVVMRGSVYYLLRFLEGEGTKGGEGKNGGAGRRGAASGATGTRAKNAVEVVGADVDAKEVATTKSVDAGLRAAVIVATTMNAKGVDVVVGADAGADADGAEQRHGRAGADPERDVRDLSVELLE